MAKVCESGGSKNDKFERDIRLLTKGIEDEPENTHRYTFDLANIYMDSNKPENAIEMYKKVLTLNNCNQEKYMACFNIYTQYEKLNRSVEGIYYLIEAYKYDKQRVECICKLVMFYCCNKTPEIAYGFYNLISESYENNLPHSSLLHGKLFVQPIMYDFYLPYFMIIVSDRVNNRQKGIKMYEMIFKKKPEFFVLWWIKNLFSNYKFFIGHILEEEREYMSILYKDYVNFLLNNNVDLIGVDLIGVDLIGSDLSDVDYSKNCVYLYWTGKEYKLISILRKLIYLHSASGKGYKVILITDKNVHRYIKNVPNYFYNLCPAHQADFVRVNVICDHGGIWLDSDTLVLDSLDSLFEIIENKNGFFIKENNARLCNGVFGSKPNTPLMIRWRTELMDRLSETNGKINWNDIGGIMLQDIYNATSGCLYSDYTIFNGLDNLYPVNWDKCVCEFIDKPYDNYKTIVREYQPLLILVNTVYKKLESVSSEQEILDGNTPLNYFINKSRAYL